MQRTSDTANFADLRVNLGLVLSGPVADLQRLLHELEVRPGIRVVYVRTSGSRLRIEEEKA